MKKLTRSHLENFLERYEKLRFLEKDIVSAVGLILQTARLRGLVLLCGNGGSAADCEHMAGELLKSFVLKRGLDGDYKTKLFSLYGEEGELLAATLQQGVRCIPLTSFCAFNTAFINDCDEKMLFAQLTGVYGDRGDVLIAFSTSGNSENIINAAKIAKSKDMKIIALTGEGGGRLKGYADVLLNAPSNVVYQIQEYHLPLYHVICLMLESELFK
jgi:D-sedoheptulose 7-phosphate isomerase